MKDVYKVRIISGHYMCHPETCSCPNYRVEYLTEEQGWKRNPEWEWLHDYASDDYDYILYKLNRDYPNAILTT